MSIVFQPAVRESQRLLLGIGGGTGSGKTLSALLIALGLAGRDGKIAVIDTEQGRSQVYAPVPGEAPDFVSTFPFVSAYLLPPFTPARYEEYIVAAAEIVGIGGVVIVDSMSHEWEGPGGLLEQASTIADAMAKRYNKSPDVYTFPSWREPKQNHQKLVNRILQLPCHMILCFRAKEKMKMVPGKPPVPLGLMPIMEDSLPYEMSIFAMLRAATPGVPEFNMKALALPFQKIIDLYRNQGGKAQFDENFGKLLREYAAGKIRQQSPKKEFVIPEDMDVTSILAKAKQVFAESGVEGLKAHVHTLNGEEGAYLRSVWKEVMSKKEAGENATA